MGLPIGVGDYQLDLGEIFVTLGAALGGPIVGLVVGFLKGIVYEPVRNVPSHMFAGFVWGIWYMYLWRYTANHRNGKWVRIGLWTVTIPVYYYVLLMPLNLWIHAIVNEVSFVSLFARIAVLAVPEIIGTIVATDIVLAILPDRLAKPVK